MNLSPVKGKTHDPELQAVMASPPVCRFGFRQKIQTWRQRLRRLESVIWISNMSLGVLSEWQKLPLSLSELCINTTLRCGQSFRFVSQVSGSGDCRSSD